MKTSRGEKKKVSKWFWIIVIIMLIWNLIGVVSFFGHVFISDETLSNLPQNEKDLYSEYPIWTTLLFAIAVFGGLLGSISLILRSKWARPYFIISFMAIVPQMIHNVFFTHSINVYGFIQAITMPVLVVVIGGFLIWYSSYSYNKKWIS